MTGRRDPSYRRIRRGWSTLHPLHHLCAEPTSSSGLTLLVVLIILLAVGVSSASFIWYMNQQQTRAGTHYRSLAAQFAAEAGVRRVLAHLEATAPDGGPGRAWRPDGFAETVGTDPLQPRFSVSAVPEPGGTLLVTSTGEAGGVRRALRVRIALASPALLAAVYGASSVEFEGAAPVLVITDALPGESPVTWTALAAGKEVWFADTDAALNEPTPLPDLLVAPGDPAGPARRPFEPGNLPALRVFMAEGAEFTLGTDRRRADVQQLIVGGLNLDRAPLRTPRLPGLPEVDRLFYQSLAAANSANAAINAAAGEFARDEGLKGKTDSVYDRAQTVKLLAYLTSLADPPPLRGVVSFTRGLTLPPGARLRIKDGALIAGSTLQLDPGAELIVTHGPQSRSLPGLLVLGNGSLVVAQRAQLHVHGLVYSSRVVDAGAGALIDIVGALASGDPQIGIRNNASTVVVRYDPAVLGTPGLIPPPGQEIIAWISLWQELPP